MNTTQQVVILSAELSTQRFEGNRQRTETLHAMLEDIKLPFNKAQGVYNGSQEDSFVVIVQNQDEIDLLKGFAFNNFGQESVLVQDSSQEAYLEYSDGKVEQLGRLEQVPQEVATKQDSYTVMNNKFYVTNKR